MISVGTKSALVENKSGSVPVRVKVSDGLLNSDKSSDGWLVVSGPNVTAKQKKRFLNAELISCSQKRSELIQAVLAMSNEELTVIADSVKHQHDVQMQGSIEKFLSTVQTLGENVESLPKTDVTRIYADRIKRFKETYEILEPGKVGSYLNSADSNISRVTSNMAEKHQLIRVTASKGQRQYGYPKFQFSGKDGGVLPVVQEMLNILDSKYKDWDLLLWMEGDKELLDGNVIDALSDPNKYEAILKTAKRAVKKFR